MNNKMIIFLIILISTNLWIIYENLVKKIYLPKHLMPYSMSCIMVSDQDHPKMPSFVFRCENIETTCYYILTENQQSCKFR